jgi:type III restriction enzyme
VHKGYFRPLAQREGRGRSDCKLILQDKEKLLSFDTDLRFIFSMWALQEGWDNPNVFTLCKLAPSNSKISKLQQIGRGLRLAVNQQLERVQADNAAFDEVNDLVVVVPASEGDFVRAIQAEISEHSLQRVSQQLSHEVLRLNGVIAGDNPFTTVALLSTLAAQGVATVDLVSGTATLALDKAPFQARRDSLAKTLLGQVPGLTAEQAKNLIGYLDAYYEGSGQVKTKKTKITPTLTLRPAQYQHFKHLWENLNRHALLRYEVDTPKLIENVLESISRNFEVRPLSISVTRTTDVETVDKARSTQAPYTIKPHSVFSMAQFLRELANMTRLSMHTVSEILQRMPAEKFDQIRHNENRALISLRDLIQRCIHELVVNRVTYDLREIRVETALTDKTGTLLKTIPVSLCGAETHALANAEVRERSLYESPVMPVDSQIERDTVDESNQQRVTVFAKLPRINIPTPLGNYNPDFGYVIARNDQPHALYLVVETKGYDTRQDIPERERWKMDSAVHFFNALKGKGIEVHYKTKINNDSLAQLIHQIDPTLAQSA